MRYLNTPNKIFSGLSLTQKPDCTRHSIYGTPPLPRNVERLRQLMFQTANDIDNFDHKVQNWDIWIKSLLEDLELFAMANDPDHPKELLNLLEKVKEIIVKRINYGDWE